MVALGKAMCETSGCEVRVHHVTTRDREGCSMCYAFRCAVAVEEENEMENDAGILCNNFDKLGELESHLIRHRELFLSRQIETYKIDMVR